MPKRKGERQPPLKVGAEYDIDGPSEKVKVRLIGRSTVMGRKKVLLCEVLNWSKKKLAK
jgi:hypothetical protein